MYGTVRYWITLSKRGCDQKLEPGKTLRKSPEAGYQKNPNSSRSGGGLISEQKALAGDGLSGILRMFVLRLVKNGQLSWLVRRRRKADIVYDAFTVLSQTSFNPLNLPPDDLRDSGHERLRPDSPASCEIKRSSFSLLFLTKIFQKGFYALKANSHPGQFLILSIAKIVNFLHELAQFLLNSQIVQRGILKDKVDVRE